MLNHSLCVCVASPIKKKKKEGRNKWPEPTESNYKRRLDTLVLEWSGNSVGCFGLCLMKNQFSVTHSFSLSPPENNLAANCFTSLWALLQTSGGIFAMWLFLENTVTTAYGGAYSVSQYFIQKGVLASPS